MDNDGSRRLSVREFQAIGPATEKAREPYTVSECVEFNVTLDI